MPGTLFFVFLPATVTRFYTCQTSLSETSLTAMPICWHTNCIYSYWPPSLRTTSLKSIHGCGYVLVRVCAFGRSEKTRENGHGEKNRQGLSWYFFNWTLLFHLRMPLKHRRCFPHTVFRRQLESLEHLEVSQIPLPWKHFHIKQPIHDKKKKKYPSCFRLPVLRCSVTRTRCHTRTLGLQSLPRAPWAADHGITHTGAITEQTATQPVSPRGKGMWPLPSEKGINDLTLEPVSKLKNFSGF